MLPRSSARISGGDLVASALERHGVRFLFTLCGGHISPILVSAKARGIRVIDVRHEATAVFAADAVARLTGVPGVAAVTAGPGVTNTVTAIRNAQLAQSPLLLLGGATATVLRGRGALQDIDQIAVMAPHVKRAISVARLRELPEALERAFEIAAGGIPGPVFVEVPVDLLYAEETVRGWYRFGADGAGLSGSLRAWYLRRHVERLFAGAGATERAAATAPGRRPVPMPRRSVARAATLVAAARRPVLLVGSQAMQPAAEVPQVAAAVERLAIPVFLTGMARGLLGAAHPLQVRHRRKEALRESDLVVLAGVACDFRLDYGRHIARTARLVAVNRSRGELARNRRPTLGIAADPGRFLCDLAAELPAAGDGWNGWRDALRRRDGEREEEMRARAAAPTSGLNPLAVCRAVDQVLPEASVLVADGGDFVATASYIVAPRGPLRWLDPGTFGTLGVGAGFALGARLCRPEAEVWILYGDGAAAYSLAELDTFARHGLSVIALIGNDAGWTQIAREQVEILGDDVGTVLAASDYHTVAEGFGAVGLRVRSGDDLTAVLRRAQAEARAGRPVLVNALLGKTDFRKGSLSI